MQKIKKIFAMVNLCIRKPKTFFKGIKYLFKHGPKGFMENFKHRADYELYPYEPQEAEAQKCTGEIRFSILMPVYNVEIKWLEAYRQK